MSFGDAERRMCEAQKRRTSPDDTDAISMKSHISAPMSIDEPSCMVLTL